MMPAVLPKKAFLNARDCVEFTAWRRSNAVCRYLGIAATDQYGARGATGLTGAQFDRTEQTLLGF